MQDQRQHEHSSAPADLSGALRTCLRIFEAWRLTAEQGRAILGLPRQTWYRWRQNPSSARLDVNTLERISYVLGIFKALQILLPDQGAADSWLNRPNDAQLFGGMRPVERLASGKVADLYEVRRFVDGMRGWN